MCAVGPCAPMGLAQAGTWVLDGWPDQRSGYFAGRTEIYADGDRLKITEWPENTEDDTQTLETYFLGQTVVKVFPWNGAAWAWCLRRLNHFPAPNATLKASSCCHPPFPRCLRKRARFPAEKGASTTSETWRSSPSMTSCSPRAECSKHLPTGRRHSLDVQGRIHGASPHRATRLTPFGVVDKP